MVSVLHLKFCYATALTSLSFFLFYWDLVVSTYQLKSDILHPMPRRVSIESVYCSGVA